jgi:hypothetical protein
MSKKQPKLAIRQSYAKGHDIHVTLIGDCGSLTITDQRLFPDSDSRAERMNLGYNTLTIPEMTREDLKRLKTAIKEVLKESN